RFWLRICIEQKRLPAASPGVRVIRTPEGDQLHVFVVFQKCPEQTGVGLGQAPVGVTDEAALGAGAVVGDIRSETTLTTLRAVHVKFGYVNGQTEGRQFRQFLIY